MRRVVKNVTENGLEKDPATIRERPGRFFGIAVTVIERLARADFGLMRCCSDNRLIHCGWMHGEVFDGGAARNTGNCAGEATVV
jgi:hypothetical protein